MAIYLRGAGSSPGVALGRAVRYLPDSHAWHAVDADIDAAMARFTAAQAMAATQMRTLAELLREEGRIEEARIFDTHALLVEDEILTQDVERRMRAGRISLEQALIAAIDSLRDAVDAIDDPYLRERSSDIDSVRRAILTALHGETRRIRDLPIGAILVANDLTPAEAVSLRDGRIAGFATAEGGPTSHTTILARAFGIPAVVGLGAATLAVPDGAPLVLDGYTGLLIVDPDAFEWSSYERRASALVTAPVRRQPSRDQPGRLASGEPVTIWANINHPLEARIALEQGAEGIGLFRTEFLFLGRSTPPDENEQYEAYRAVVEMMEGRPVIIRTLDIGGDKRVEYLDLPHEPNPSLGIRGLRLAMRRPDLFQTQIRAMLRAATHGDLRILLPMVAIPDEVTWAREQIHSAAESLARQGIPHRADVPVGVMIETPAAAITADLLAREAAFFSIGTNDLAQYALAADRTSADVSARYSQTSAAILRLIAQTVGAAIRARLPVCVCGESAGAPDVAPLLIGLGVSQLSMNPASISIVKERLSETMMTQAQAAAHAVLNIYI
ncbi:phosphoenolpyruvate--protein phosphotransferase [Roseiflexus castenholzii]|uniref:phosphoenolpyruvate--protein phosphotransferase n=1 Tax=Roseiflexus castenholzii TaxID=120962 RepID=UPI003C7A550D